MIHGDQLDYIFYLFGFFLKLMKFGGHITTIMGKYIMNFK
jgi:hypothetical protein